MSITPRVTSVPAGLSWRRVMVGAVRSAARALPLVVVLWAGGAVAAADERHPLQPADTSSPRATLASFLAEAHGAHALLMGGRTRASRVARASAANRLLRCLDLSTLPPAVRTSLAKEAAVCLKETLDRIELPPETDWPGAEETTARDLTKWTIPHTEISIVEIAEGPRQGEFLFSAATVERATEFYGVVKDRAYIDRGTTTPGFYEMLLAEPGWMIPRNLIPSWARTRWGGQAIWQWVGLVLTLLVSVAAMVGIYWIGRRRSTMLRNNVARYWITLAFPITAVLVPVAAGFFVVHQLQIYGHLVVAVEVTLRVIFLLALMTLIIGVGNRLAELIIATPWIQSGGPDSQFVRLACRVLSIVGAAVVLLEGGHQLGISLATLLTGAGVGGLALALAAQDSLKNILGSMMIMLDKPFRVGDQITARGYNGFVEDIGLRSTKIRLLTGHQASIPNEMMGHAEIENISRRPFILRNVTIELPSDTPAEKLGRALEILHGLLKDHEGMAEDHPPRVFLRDINESSIGISLAYWYHPPEWWKFQAFSEQINLQIAARFEAEGIPFASPALTIHTQAAGESAG